MEGEKWMFDEERGEVVEAGRKRGKAEWLGKASTTMAPFGERKSHYSQLQRL